MTLGVYYFDGDWFDEPPRIVGPMSHAFWMSSVVFDGARAIGGLVPDLELHCERLMRSADAMYLAPKIKAEEIADLCREGVRRLPRDKDFYIRPAFYAEEGFINPVPESTLFVLAICVPRTMTMISTSMAASVTEPCSLPRLRMGTARSVRTTLERPLIPTCSSRVSASCFLLRAY